MNLSFLDFSTTPFLSVAAESNLGETKPNP